MSNLDFMKTLVGKSLLEVLTETRNRYYHWAVEKYDVLKIYVWEEDASCYVITFDENDEYALSFELFATDFYDKKVNYNSPSLFRVTGKPVTGPEWDADTEHAYYDKLDELGIENIESFLDT